MSFLGFANYYREFIKGYADKIYPMQKLMRNKGKNLSWMARINSPLKTSIANFAMHRSSASRQKGDVCMRYRRIKSCGVGHASPGTRRTVLRRIAYGSKTLSDDELKYGAPKAEMFADITFVEKYRFYIGSAPFKLLVDNRALAWLKTYWMDQSYIGRWIVRLDGYHKIIEHRNRDKHQIADSLSKKTEFYD